MRIKNLSIASHPHLLLALLISSTTSSAFAFPTQIQTTLISTNPVDNKSSGIASASQPTAIQKNTVSSPISSKVTWSQLSTDQKTALAPLENEWDKMDAMRQKKWLAVANKYASMKPEEQQRVQERVQTWVKMTPEQRMAVRENFANTSKKSPEQKSAQWQQYQQLSDAEKQKLANEAKTKKSITTIQPESKRTTPALAPLKKGPPAITPASSSASQASIKVN